MSGATGDISERVSRARAHPDSRSGLLKRLQFWKQVGIPRMKVLPMSKLVELGRIPHSSEGFAVDAADALAGFPQGKLSRPRAPIYLFSHGWLRPDWCEALQKNVAHGTEEWAQAQQAGQRVGDPDDADAAKARSLIQTLRWFVEEHSMTQASSWEKSTTGFLQNPFAFGRRWPTEHYRIPSDSLCVWSTLADQTGLARAKAPGASLFVDRMDMHRFKIKATSCRRSRRYPRMCRAAAVS